MRLLLISAIAVNLILSHSPVASALCSDGSESALSRIPDEAVSPVTCRRYSGHASIYASRLNGRRTASGERYSTKRLTAAHRTFSFGTRVRLINKENGRQVSVKINDRGPYVRGRDIDLSAAAARALGVDDVAAVELEVCDE